MSRPRETAFLLEGEASAGRFLEVVCKLFAVECRNGPEIREVCYDTFDWRFASANRQLTREGSQLRLATLDTGEILAEARVRSVRDSLLPARFPAGDLRDATARLAGNRALLPLATITTLPKFVQCRNEAAKTVLRVTIEHIGVLIDDRLVPVSLRARIRPLRGYGDALNSLIEELAAIGIHPDHAPGTPTLLAVKAAGKEPFGYSSKIALDLTPNLGAREAARQIHRHSIRMMRSNIDGMRADTDAEFLHDFRVALRRTRSALSLLKGIFPPEAVAPHREALRELSKATNRLRDFDVYLPRHEEYRELVPDFLQPAIDRFFEQLAEERKKERRRFLKEVTPKRIETVLGGWETVVEDTSLPSDDCPNALAPVGTVATELLSRNLRRVYTDGAEVGPKTPDEDLHRLRIDCKKVRYLLEFFSSLWPEGEMAPVVRRLRKIQNVLGDLNDIHVQQADLRGFLSRLPSDPGSVELAAAIGALIRSLDQGKTALRAEFRLKFRRFRAPEITTCVAELLGPKTIRPLSPT